MRPIELPHLEHALAMHNCIGCWDDTDFAACQAYARAAVQLDREARADHVLVPLASPEAVIDEVVRLMTSGCPRYPGDVDFAKPLSHYNLSRGALREMYRCMVANAAVSGQAGR